MINRNKQRSTLDMISPGLVEYLHAHKAGSAGNYCTAKCVVKMINPFICLCSITSQRYPFIYLARMYRCSLERVDVIPQ